MSPAQTYESQVTSMASHQYDVSENYEGQYRFAPIEEAQVSRAMIKRYGFSNLQSDITFIIFIDISISCTKGQCPMWSLWALEVLGCLALGSLVLLGQRCVVSIVPEG